MNRDPHGRDLRMVASILGEAFSTTKLTSISPNRNPVRRRVGFEKENSRGAVEMIGIAKSLHIIGVIVWFSGLFYIGRLFVYHREARTERVMRGACSVSSTRSWSGGSTEGS